MATCCDVECSLSPFVVYYNQRSGNGLSLNRDAYPVCENSSLPPEIISGTYNLNTSPYGCGLKFRFWRNIFSDCNSEQTTDVTTQTVVVTCTSGSIKVNGETLNSGGSKTFNTIAFDPSRGGVPNSTLGEEIVVKNKCCPPQDSASFTITATLDWSTQRDHDLYGTVSCAVIGPCQSPFNCPGHEGSGGWCNCNCKCCPPCPCYTQFKFDCNPCPVPTSSGIINPSSAGWTTPPTKTSTSINAVFTYEDSGGGGGVIGENGTCGAGTNPNTQTGSGSCSFTLSEEQQVKLKVFGNTEDQSDAFDNAWILLSGPGVPPDSVYGPRGYSYHVRIGSLGLGQGCNMFSKSDENTYTLGPGTYTVNFEANTYDSLYHQNMVHNFEVTWSTPDAVANANLLTVDFTGCCMRLISQTSTSIKFVTIGCGSVSVSSSYVPPITVQINGETTTSKNVDDCEEVTITWDQECYYNFSYTLLPRCNTSSFIKIKNKSNGLEKIYLNKNKIINKIKQLRIRKLRR